MNELDLMADGEKISCNLGNYYGDVELTREGGKYFLELENWDGYGRFSRVEVTAEFARAYVKEFRGEK